MIIYEVQSLKKIYEYGVPTAKDETIKIYKL